MLKEYEQAYSHLINKVFVMKHAYLIMAHNNPEVLLTLLRMIDDVRNDIYIHIDKKSNLLDLINIRTEKSKCYILNNRIDVRWGDVSQVETEYILFEESFKNGPYSYYHILSGVDLPIKNQDYIHAFFDNHINEEFIGFCDQSLNRRKMDDNFNRYLFFSKQMRLGSTLFDIFRRSLNKFCGIFIRRKSSFPVYEGPNWASVTEEVIKELLSKKDFILSRFKMTQSSDEVFLQSIVANSPQLMKRTHIKCLNEDNRDRCLRAIDWERGSPYVWRISDIKTLENSKMLFARKFDWNIDSSVIRWVEIQWGHN